MLGGGWGEAKCLARRQRLIKGNYDGDCFYTISQRTLGSGSWPPTKKALNAFSFLPWLRSSVLSWSSSRPGLLGTLIRDIWVSLDVCIFTDTSKDFYVLRSSVSAGEHPNEAKRLEEGQ